MSTVIGIDPGSTYLGLAIMEVELYSGRVMSIEAHTIVPATVYRGLQYQDGTYSSLSTEQRINLISSSLAHKLASVEPVMIAIEAPFYNRRFPNAYAVLQKQLMCLISDVLQPTVPYAEICTYAPMHIKKCVGASTKGGKDAVRAGLINLGLNQLVVGYDGLSEHAIDAIAIGYTGLLAYNG